MPTAPQMNNTYVPEVTDRLVVDFSRDPAKFPINRYIQIVPTDKQAGYYLAMTRDQAGRIDATGKGDDWPDGQDRPTHNDDLESFDFKLFGTKRRDKGFNLGDLAVQQANWDTLGVQAGQTAERVIRTRTQLAINAATTSANYDATHVSAVFGGSIPGTLGGWDASTTVRMDIKRSLDYAADLIIQDSLNGVQPQDLILVISRGCARKLTLSQEIVDHIKQSPEAYAMIRGDLPNRNKFFGLPETLYGYQVVVEDTAKTTSKKGAASTTKTSILADATPFMCARPGSLVSERATTAPSFATLVCFMKEEMTFETQADTWNRLKRCAITEDYAMVVAAPVSGFLFTGAVS